MCFFNQNLCERVSELQTHTHTHTCAERVPSSSCSNLVSGSARTEQSKTVDARIDHTHTRTLPSTSTIGANANRVSRSSVRSIAINPSLFLMSRSHLGACASERSYASTALGRCARTRPRAAGDTRSRSCQTPPCAAASRPPCLDSLGWRPTTAVASLRTSASAR